MPCQSESDPINCSTAVALALLLNPHGRSPFNYKLNQPATPRWTCLHPPATAAGHGHIQVVGGSPESFSTILGFSVYVRFLHLNETGPRNSGIHLNSSRTGGRTYLDISHSWSVVIPPGEQSSPGVEQMMLVTTNPSSISSTFFMWTIYIWGWVLGEALTMPKVNNWMPSLDIWLSYPSSTSQPEAPHHHHHRRQSPQSSETETTID